MVDKSVDDGGLRELAPDFVVSDDGDTCGNKRAGEPSPNVAQEELRKGEPVGGAVNCSASELSIYLQGLEEGFLPTFYSDTSQSARSKSMSIASRSYQRGKKMVVFHGFPSLQMSRNLKGELGEAVLTWFLAGFPVRTSAQQEKGQESPVGNPVSGPNLLASFARFDPDTSSWKIPQCSLLGDSEPFSETWPQWGMWDTGACWELPTLVPRISGNGSGLWQTPKRGMWPTPVAHDDGKTPEAHMRMKKNMPGGARHKPTSLQVMVKGLAKGMFSGYLPTPTATNAKQGVNSTAGGSSAGRPLLPMAASMLPTPTGQDAHNNGSQSQQACNSKPLNAVVGGALNPDWAEWLMNWPIKWSSLNAINPQEFKRWAEASAAHLQGSSCVRTGWWDRDPSETPHGPDCPRIVKNSPARANRLKAIGNGQVPQCAAKAWRILSG